MNLTQTKFQATAQGINLANYNRHVFVFLQSDNCGFVGVGTVGGNPSRTWILSCDCNSGFDSIHSGHRSECTGCRSADLFAITPGVSAGWSSTLASADGTEGTALVQVNSNGFNFPTLSTIAWVDALPPSAPTNLTATAASRSISLQWTASQDNQAIARYEVLHNGTVIGSVTGIRFLDANVSSKTSYRCLERAIPFARVAAAGSEDLQENTRCAFPALVIGRGIKYYKEEQVRIAYG